MNKQKLIVLCGLQGSGKSTVAKTLAEKYSNLFGSTSGPYSEWGGQAMTDFPAVIISSDQIRKDHPEIANDNDKVFDKYYADINYFLRKGSNVIADATNITIKSRKQIFERVKEPCKKICYIVNTPIETCRERLTIRNQDPNTHFVPLDVLDKYHKSFQVPFKEEGWDEILLDWVNIDYDEDYILNKMFHFDQNNPNHSLSLGEHSTEVFSRIVEQFNPGININNIIWSDIENGTKETINLIRGAHLHDVGKLFTRLPNKNNPEYDSYLSHAEVGAYWKLCNGFTVEETFYENYHMMTYNWQTEKAINKWKKIFGEEKFNNLLLLNKADKEAH